MKSVIIFSLIVAFMFIAYLLSSFLQKVIKPRQSAGRLVVYFLSVLASIFILSFLMVMLIGKLYPNELMK